MKREQRYAGVTGLVLAGAMALGLMVACEDDGPSQDASFTVSPAAVTLGRDEPTAAFQTVGGIAPFSWSVSDSNLGAVSGSGTVVNYTRTAATGVNMVQVTDGRQWQASAQVVQTAGTNAAGNAVF